MLKTVTLVNSYNPFNKLVEDLIEETEEIEENNITPQMHKSRIIKRK